MLVSIDTDSKRYKKKKKNLATVVINRKENRVAGTGIRRFILGLFGHHLNLDHING